MEWVELEPREMAAFDSRGIRMVAIARLSAESESRVHVASVAPGGVLGRHPTRSWQLFHVLSGSGWVSGGDEVRKPISTGQAVLWSPGEEHESGSDLGMAVLIVQSSHRPA
jgi:quercetin dioxygenase-like cupin family protein